MCCAGFFGVPPAIAKSTVQYFSTYLQKASRELTLGSGSRMVASLLFSSRKNSAISCHSRTCSESYCTPATGASKGAPQSKLLQTFGCSQPYTGAFWMKGILISRDQEMLQGDLKALTGRSPLDGALAPWGYRDEMSMPHSLPSFVSTRFSRLRSSMV